jgi:hypothetical protein
MTMNNLIQKTKTPGWWSEPKNIATAIVVLSCWRAGLRIPDLCIALAGDGDLESGQPGDRRRRLRLPADDRHQPEILAGLKYFSEFIANYSIGLAIELNPFNILQAKIDQGYKDRNTLYKQSARD